MGAYPDATHGAVIFTYIIHHYPTLTPILLPSFVGFYLPAPWVHPSIPKACASDIALQTVGVTAVNCFAGGRFVFIGRDDGDDDDWSTRNLELIG